MSAEYSIDERSYTDATEKDIKAIFAEVAEKEHGVEVKDVDITADEELKIKWIRTSGTINLLSVSDYLVGIPVRAVYDIARVLYNRMYCKTDATVEWSHETAELLSSDEYMRRWQGVYIERHGFSKGLGTKGKEFLRAVKDVEGFEVPKGIAFVYTDRETVQSSVSMRVVAVPKSMRNASKEALWYIFDRAVRRIAGGIGECHGYREEPLVSVDISEGDKGRLIYADAWREE